MPGNATYFWGKIEKVNVLPVLESYCPYANLFKPELVLENQQITVPFVIFSHDNREFLEGGDCISLQLTLVGDFSDYWEYFLKSFEFAFLVPGQIF